MLCEVDPVVMHVLRVRFPNVELTDDVRDVLSLRGTSILYTGFPCQNSSSSGNRVGISGSQLSLAGEVFRVLKTSYPKWVIIEDVRFMFHLNKGEATRRITESFEQPGYNWAYRVVDS